MRKIYVLFCGAILSAVLIIAFYPGLRTHLFSSKDLAQKEEAYYSNPKERDLLEFEKIKDPALGYVPTTRMDAAIQYTEEQKALLRSSKVQSLLWTERGPIFDSVGPSNGNGRGGSTGYTGGYTSGRIRAVLIDKANDPSGNTVFAGGVAGGVWKTTNFLTENPHWEAIDDRFNNLAISSICQDPTNPQVMYFSTGEATSNADAVFGKGVWKSTDGGKTWNHLPSTTNFIRTFKILCDAAGNVYVAARPTTTPAAQPAGLLRSLDGGSTWTNITPTGLSSNSNCTDIEISSTGRFHASFGYVATIVNHRYTDNPATVTPGGWSASTGIRQYIVPATGRTDTARRMELAVLGNVVYAVTVNRLDNVDSCYKSVDGGATFTKQNTTIFTSGLGSSQGWYNLTLAINPSNTNEIIIGGLDAYRSTNSGQTISRLTFWVGVGAYVHADHHFIQWWNDGGENRILIGCDGGLFYSKNAGTSWVDKNKGLAIKQFYSCTIHPEAGSPYLLGGTQDNGSHQLKRPGLSYSHEVTGGDGCFTHINQQNPNIQFTSFVFNQYRRSTNGGQSWSSVNFTTAGLFVNPFDYDDATNTMYASLQTDGILRWPNAHTSTTANILGITGLGMATAFKVSPHTANRLFLGGSTSLFRLNNANTVTTAQVPANITNIRGAGFPAGFLSNIEVGTSDDFLVVTFSNYGVNNVWYSSNAGASWTAIDGNLPDMPVRWAVFEPGDNTKLLLATEAGVYSTEMVNGASTVWKPNPSFPTVRTDMLKVRASDNTIAAATHGRGLFTAMLPANNDPIINFAGVVTNAKEEVSQMIGCRGYKDYIVNVGLMNEAEGDATVTINVQGGSTAVKEVDFDFTTNNDFNNPSSTLTFPDGSTGLKPVRVRIYDDAEVDPDEYFTLVLSVSGETNATAGGQNTHTFSIADNDAAPKVLEPTTHAVGTYNGDINAQSPFAANRVKHRMQALFYSSELKAAGLYGQVDLTSIAIKVITKGSTKPYNGLTVSLANTSSSTLASGYAPEALTQVFSEAYSTVVGENLIRFTTPFKWDGKSNLIVQFCFDNAGQPADAAADIVEGNLSALGTLVRGTTYSNFTTGTTAGCSLTAAFVSDFRMNATFGAMFGNPIATLLNTNKTEYMTAGNDLYFYSNTGEIIARVRNLSSHTYGCTNVKIDRAGTGAASFWNKNKKNYVMDKTYQLIPTTNDPGGRYEVTLYYTAAERAGWEAATGNSWNDIQLIKTSGRISEVTPQNAQPGNNGTVQEVVEAIKSTYGDGYTLTAIFESGFGGIGAGMPGRQFNNDRVDITSGGGAEGSQQMVVLTNPFRNNIQVRFSKMTTTPVEASLYDIQGRLVKKYKAGPSQTLVLNVNDVLLGSGTYILNVTADRQLYKAKLLKKE